MAGGGLDGQQHMIAAAYHLILAMESNSSHFSDDVRTLLSDLNLHLSQMVRNDDADSRNRRDIEFRLVSAHNTITARPNLTHSCPLTLRHYLLAVEDVRSSITTLETTPLIQGTGNRDLLDRAHSILQISMAHLQNHLIHTLVQNKQCFGASPGRSSEDDETLSNVSRRESSSTEEADDYPGLELIHPDVVPRIKSITDAMFASGYGPEFRWAFTAFWRDAMAEYLNLFDVDGLGVEDVVRMEWKQLNARIRTWRAVVKRTVSVYLPSTKRLFDQILADCGACVSSTCLIEASRPSLMCLMNFGHAVLVVPHRPEWLFCLLDMYEALASMVADVDVLFPEETGSLFRFEFHELLVKLGESARAIFEQVGNHIASCSSTTPYMNGGIPPLTKYVINYIVFVADYGDTLKSLLQAQTASSSEGCGESLLGDKFSIVGAHLRSMTAILEHNLSGKSALYKDEALKHIFMMNNIHYMVHKIIGSKAEPYFGEDWIRTRIIMFRGQVRYYERITWGPILVLLNGNEKRMAKATLKARFQAFAVAFEDVYKSQTRWCVPDATLREELKISILKTLVLAYRNFVNVVAKSIEEKHVKYTEQDLAAYVLDLFEGKPKSLSHLRKR